MRGLSREPKRTEAAKRGPRECSDADSRNGGEQPAPDFMDAVLWGLLNAQAVWLATRDPAALRRRLIEMLAALG